MGFVQADVEAIAPELTGKLSAEAWTLLLEVSGMQVAGIPEGRKRDMAAIYLAAHLASMSKPGGGGGSGALSSVTVGAVTKAFAVPSGDTEALQSTRYGKQYLQLIRLWAPRAALL